jgi:hypothetical protein
MDILMLGCSYGVPNYFGPASWPESIHTEFLLKDKGHQVHNCSINGGSNLDSLNRAIRYLDGDTIQHPAYKDKIIQCDSPIKIDAIIWFHAELTRDSTVSTSEIYTRFAKFFNTINKPVAVIGGSGDVDFEFINYYQPDFFVPSWRRSILGIATPLTNSLSSADSIKHSNLTTEQKLHLLDNNLQVLDMMAASEHFPDGCHPGAKPHKDLVEQLISAKFIT